MEEKKPVGFCWFSHAVLGLTNKWSVTKNRAHSEGEAPEGLQTTAALARMWSTKLMNTTKRERGVTRLVFYTVYHLEQTGGEQPHWSSSADIQSLSCQR